MFANNKQLLFERLRTSVLGGGSGGVAGVGLSTTFAGSSGVGIHA